jgi:hypothetical protein
MRGYTFLLSFLALPVLAALGHDIYITYQDQNFDKAMMFSNVGWLWTHYHVDTFGFARENMSPANWHTFNVYVLEQKTILVAAVPFIVTAVILAILRILNLPPFRDSGSLVSFKKKGFGFGSGDKKQGRFKYNRK